MSVPPVRITASTPSCDTSRCADGAAAAGRELQRRFRHAGSPEALAQQVRDQHGVGRRLEDDGVAGGERGRDAAAGNREREVPRRDDDDHALAAALRRRAARESIAPLSA